MWANVKSNWRVDLFVNWAFNNIVSGKKGKMKSPWAGLEPETLRLKVSRSTNWATKAPRGKGPQATMRRVTGGGGEDSPLQDGSLCPPLKITVSNIEWVRTADFTAVGWQVAESGCTWREKMCE